VLAVGAALPTSLTYNETQSFNATLPAAWVQGALRVSVDVDPDQRFGPTSRIEATPRVGTDTRIDLVLVPLVSGSNAPQMPNIADVVDELVRRFPAARERIAVSLRSAYTLTSVTDGVDTSSEWSSVLSELEQLRRREAPTRHYYGMVRPMVSAGVAGIGYVNGIGGSSPALSSLGWDATRSGWRRTMTHELGHNLSRLHAPCGNVGNPDANYPYAGGALSPTPLFESLLADIQAPTNQTDVMGYCSGAWFSDYNLREIQRFLEARPQAATLQAFGADAEGEALIVSGRIDENGVVTLEPVQRMRGAAPLVARGEHTLRMTTAAGPVVEVAFDPIAVDHVDEAHFHVVVPAPGALARVEVAHGGRMLPLRSAATRQTQGAAPAAAAGPALIWREVRSGAAGQLHVNWNGAAYPHLTVTHVSGSARTVLALNPRGGTAQIDLSGVPAGGELEFSVSDGLNAQVIVGRR
jgi:hypothetical protein